MIAPAYDVDCMGTACLLDTPARPWQNVLLAGQNPLTSLTEWGKFNAARLLQQACAQEHNTCPTVAPSQHRCCSWNLTASCVAHFSAVDSLLLFSDNFLTSLSTSYRNDQSVFMLLQLLYCIQGSLHAPSRQRS